MTTTIMTLPALIIVIIMTTTMAVILKMKCVDVGRSDNNDVLEDALDDHNAGGDAGDEDNDRLHRTDDEEQKEGRGSR